jgi:hypothetical protein
VVNVSSCYGSETFGQVIITRGFGPNGLLVGNSGHPELLFSNLNFEKNGGVMKRLILLGVILTVSAFASAQTGGQATVVSGYASTMVAGPGVYALPNPPLITTPSVSLDATSAPAVGASNATAGNVAGATSSTLSITAQPVNGPFAAPAWYGSANPVSSGAGYNPAPVSSQPRSSENIDLGIATFQDSEGVARLMSEQHVSKDTAPRVLSNDDLSQGDNQESLSPGTVKYNGKIEQLNSSH